jgi:plasmid stability protein
MARRPRRRAESEQDKVTLRNVDGDVWQRFRIACIRRGTSMGDLLMVILRDWLARNEPPPVPPSGPSPERER